MKTLLRPSIGPIRAQYFWRATERPSDGCAILIGRWVRDVTRAQVYIPGTLFPRQLYSNTVQQANSTKNLYPTKWLVPSRPPVNPPEERLPVSSSPLKPPPGFKTARKSAPATGGVKKPHAANHQIHFPIHGVLRVLRRLMDG